MVILQYKCGKKVSSAKKYRIRNMKDRRITAEVFTGEIIWQMKNTMNLYKDVYKRQINQGREHIEEN